MDLNGHAPEGMLEEYSRAKLPDAEVECFEEHLLVCPRCQDRLAEMDAFVDATRRAAAQLRKEQAVFVAMQRGVWRWFPHPAWLAAAAGLAILLLGGAELRRAGYRSEPAFSVYLQAERGGETPTSERAPAARPLRIHLDSTGLPALESYRVEIVDSSGARVFEAVTRREAGDLVVEMTRPLAAARYWVRLYEPGPAGALLREFGLQVR
jgi:anti-sigma factor RsiW